MTKKLVVIFSITLICIFQCQAIEPSFDDQILDNKYVFEETAGLDTNKTFSGISFSNFLNRIKFIFPGTLWCGSGSKAKDFKDLGEYAKTDSCCRNHDNCPNIISVAETKYGLKNNGKFTRSHCDCDVAFYNCLKTANTAVSKSIGITYFRVLEPQCFKLAHPKQCKQTIRGKCAEYTFDNTKSKVYQWFDNLSF